MKTLLRMRHMRTWPLSGLGIRSSIFRVNSSFFVTKGAKEWFACEKERITSIALLSWATAGNRSPSLFCEEQQERFAHSRSFEKSDESESLTWIFKKERLSKEQPERFALGHKKGGKLKNCQKHMKKTFFSSKSLVFWKWFARIKSKSLTLLFLKEIESDSLTVTHIKQQWVRFAYGCSFIKSDESLLLTVAL